MRSRFSRRCGVVLFITLSTLVFVFSFSCQSVRTSPRTYLVLYAFPAEGKLLGDAMAVDTTEKALGRAVQIGKLSEKQVVLAESGVGMTNAAMTTQYLIDRYRPAAIIFSGIAGAIDTAVAIGDIVVCRQWATHDYGYVGKDGFTRETVTAYIGARDETIETTFFVCDTGFLATAGRVAAGPLPLDNIGDRPPKVTVGGTGVSGNSFIDSRDKRAWLQTQFQALVTDMESAAVAQVCTANDISFIIFRSASDLAGGSGSETAAVEIQQFFKVAADNSSKVVMQFLSELQ
jgi:adenosylhomocysteine nucleosidase